MSDEGINEARDYFSKVFENSDGDYFECNNFESKKAPYCLLLIDGIEDPQNLGQIIRTCECSGINGILLPKNRSTPIPL